MVRRYRVLNPCALPSGATIVQKAGVGHFMEGDVLDELTARRLGGRSLVLSGTLVEFHVQEEASV